MKRKIPNDYSPQAIGARLQKRRRELGYDQKEVAEKIGVQRSAISNWEHGIRTPNFYTVKLLCRIYKVPMDYIYGTSDHTYNIQIPDYFEIDFTKLNDDGMIMLYDYYKYLIGNEKYSLN